VTPVSPESYLQLEIFSILETMRRVLQSVQDEAIASFRSMRFELKLKIIEFRGEKQIENLFAR